MLIGDLTEEAVAMSEQMRRAWIAFAADGDPGWPTYDTGSVRVFDVEPTVMAYPEQISREIWLDYPGVLDLA